MTARAGSSSTVFVLSEGDTALSLAFTTSREKAVLGYHHWKQQPHPNVAQCKELKISLLPTTSTSVRKHTVIIHSDATEWFDSLLTGYWRAVSLVFPSSTSGSP